MDFAFERVSDVSSGERPALIGAFALCVYRSVCGSIPLYFAIIYLFSKRSFLPLLACQCLFAIL
jgi:hypothetical protein